VPLILKGSLPEQVEEENEEELTDQVHVENDAGHSGSSCSGSYLS